VFTLLGETPARLLNRGIWFGDVFSLRADPDAGRRELLRSYRHCEHNRRRIESEKSSFVAPGWNSALRGCFSLRGEENHSDEQTSAHHCSCLLLFRKSFVRE
jgi:hypothetical protein